MLGRPEEVEERAASCLTAACEVDGFSWLENNDLDRASFPVDLEFELMLSS